MADKHEENQFSASVKKMTDEELSVELGTLRGKHFTLRSQMVTDKIDDFTQFGIAKRNIARVLTEQNSRQRAKAAK